MIRDPDRNVTENIPNYHPKIEDVEPECICFALRQAKVFYWICEQMSLPISNPIIFFSELNRKIGIDTPMLWSEADVADYFTLMLLYALYGNTLFNTEDIPVSELTTRIISFSFLNDLEILRSKVHKLGLEPVVIRHAQHKIDRKAFFNGAEFLDWEEWNCKFSAVRDRLVNADPVNFDGKLRCPEELTREIFDIFLTLL